MFPAALFQEMAAQILLVTPLHHHHSADSLGIIRARGHHVSHGADERHR